MPTPIVFFDIAGPDEQQLLEFYSKVFDWQLDDRELLSVPAVTPLPGAIRQDPAEKRIYLGVADVAASLADVEAHGGSIDQPRFEVPGTVILGLFRDPAGNPMGLIEMDGDRLRVPESG